ncbi:hypothetical protein ACGFNU_13240 [Spirillospora sp. NPDC048911]|uniref:hypothetical protein n=1 Tax=Spirillospora sp. NPDC048911 TaxID=3364527 RepID=UPI003720E727
MIILSGVLVVVAIALLVAGIVAGNGESAQVFGLDALVVIYISIAVSIVSALCLALGVFLRRKELFGAGAAPSAAKSKKTRKSKGKKAAPARGKAAPAKDEPADDAVTIPAPPADVPDDAVVFVVRGRKRYHLGTCRQLAGRDKEELTYVEAKEEGFSPCTACMPDTALAARAAVSVPTAAAGAKAKTKAKTAELPRTSATTSPAKAPATPSKGPVPAPEPKPAASAASSAAPPAAAPVGDIAQAAAKPAPSSPAPSSPAEKPAGSGSSLPSAWPAPAPPASPPKDEPAESATPKPREAAGADRPETSTVSAAAKSSAAPAESGDGPQVRILSGTKRYHRTDCALIEDIGDEADDLEALSRAEAKARGCTPCLVCQPDKEHARD